MLISPPETCMLKIFGKFWDLSWRTSPVLAWIFGTCGTSSDVRLWVVVKALVPINAGSDVGGHRCTSHCRYMWTPLAVHYPFCFKLWPVNLWKEFNRKLVSKQTIFQWKIEEKIVSLEACFHWKKCNFLQQQHRDIFILVFNF